MEPKDPVINVYAHSRLRGCFVRLTRGNQPEVSCALASCAVCRAGVCWLVAWPRPSEALCLGWFSGLHLPAMLARFAWVLLAASVPCV